MFAYVLIITVVPSLLKKVKDTVAGILYRIITLTVKVSPASAGKNHLLIIKIDEIGDYMLFRNLLKYFRQSPRFRDHKITLLGNSAWKGIFDQFDSDTVDEAIWLTKNNYKRNLRYRFAILRQIRALDVSDVVNCILSRSIIVDDCFAWVATGEKKIAMNPDKANRGKAGFDIDFMIYSETIFVGKQRKFDALRNRDFISTVLGMSLPATTRVQVKDSYCLPVSNYFVIFIGAGNKIERKWPLEYFLHCAAHCASRYGLTPIICGGPTDTDEALAFMNAYSGEAINLAGKTTLSEYMSIVSKAKLHLSVDTGPMHMACASGCPVIALYSGVHFGRFGPYPKEVSDRCFAVYPDAVDEMVKNDDPTLDDEFKLKNDSIRTIKPEKVIAYIDEALSALALDGLLPDPETTKKTQ